MNSAKELRLREMQPFLRFIHIVNRVHNQFPFEYCRARDCRLLYVTDGNGKFMTDGGALPMRRGSLFLWQPDCRYYIDPLPSLTMIIVDFDYTLDFTRYTHALYVPTDSEYTPDMTLQTVRFTDCDELNACLCRENAADAEGTLRQLLNRYTSTVPYSREIAGFRLALLIAELAENKAAAASTGNQTAAARILEYIRSNYLRPGLTAAEIAGIFHYHPNYVSRIVLRETGMPLHRYVIGLRLHHAESMLQDGRYTMDEVARGCGFSSVSYFCRCFRRSKGVTPGSLRAPSAP